MQPAGALTVSTQNKPTIKIDKPSSTTNPEKKNKFLAVCSKVWSVVKSIFYFLFCCCLCNRKPKKMKKEVYKEINDGVAAFQARITHDKPEKPSGTSGPMDPKAQFSDWNLSPTKDPDLIDIQTFVSNVVKSYLLDSDFQTTVIKPTVNKVCTQVDEVTKVSYLKDKCKGNAGLLYGIKQLFGNALQNKFLSFNDLDSYIKLTQKVGRQLINSLHSHLTKNAETPHDKIQVAKIVYNEIYENLKDPQYQQMYNVTNEEVLFFATNQEVIQEFINKLAHGIIQEGISTIEIMSILDDLLAIMTYFTELSKQESLPTSPRADVQQELAQKLARRDEIFADIQKLGEDFCREFPDIEHDSNRVVPGICSTIIRNNIDMIVQHFTSRTADLFKERKAKNHVYGQHVEKVDRIISALNDTLSAVIVAENKRLGRVELDADNNVQFDAERDQIAFATQFAKQKPKCHEKISVIMGANEKNLDQTLDETRATFITELAQQICQLFFRPAYTKNDAGVEIETPWLRVLWNSLIKPPALERLLNSTNEILKKIIETPNIGIQDKNVANKLINVMQRVIIHVINREITQFFEKYVVQLIFDLLGNKQMLFKLLFDLLLYNKIANKFYVNRKMFEQDFFNLHKAVGKEKQAVREKMAEKMYKLFGDQDKFQFDKEGVDLEQFKNLFIQEFIKEKIEIPLAKLELPANVTKEQLFAEIYKICNDKGESADQLSENLRDRIMPELIDKLVFGLGKLDITGSHFAVGQLNSTIISLCANFLVPLRKSPYYFVNVYKKNLQEQISTNGVVDPKKTFAYFSKAAPTDGEPDLITFTAKPITDAQFKQFANLLYDVIATPASNNKFKNLLIKGGGWFLSNKVEQMEMTVKRIFNSIYDHPIVELSSLMKIRDIYAVEPKALLAS